MIEMTEEDFKAGTLWAGGLLTQVKDMKPAAAVAGLAMGLAMTAHLAQCGPKAATTLFHLCYEQIANAALKNERS